MAALRIISYNVNGIRAAMKKGLVDWLKTNPADIICLQETKAEKDNVAHAEFASLGYQDLWFIRLVMTREGLSSLILAISD